MESASCVFKRNFRGFFWDFLCSYNSGLRLKKIRLLEMFSGRVVHNAFCVSRSTCWWKVFLEKLILSLVFFSPVSGNFLDVWRWKFLQVCPRIIDEKGISRVFHNCIQRVWRKILRTFIFLEKFCSVFFWTLRKKVADVSRSFCQITSSYDRETFGLLLTIFRQGCQNCILRVRRNLWRIKFWNFSWDFVRNPS